MNKFTDGTVVEHNTSFKTDVSYKFYLGRVSAIGRLTVSNEVTVDYDVTDPDQIEFTIYQNKTIGSVGTLHGKNSDLLLKFTMRHLRSGASCAQKFGHYYLKAYYPWIFKFFGRLKKKEPELFKSKVKSLFKKGDLLLPKRSARSNEYLRLLDYSEMDDFAQVFYSRYLRDYDFKSY